jgi:hypothetical protein
MKVGGETYENYPAGDDFRHYGPDRGSYRELAWWRRNAQGTVGSKISLH